MSYASSSAFALFGAFTLHEWMSLVGGVCVVSTVFINRHYKKKVLEEIRKRPITERLYEKISR